MSETRKYQSTHGTAIATKREINGNTYLVVLFPEKSSGERLVIVYANTIDGRDDGWPLDLYGMMKPDYDSIIRYRFHGEVDKGVATAVNRAVDYIESRMESVENDEEKVLSALDANQEVHEQ